MIFRLSLISIILNISLASTIFAQNKRFITFYASKSAPVGHAFVSFVREDPKLQMTVLDGCWGFYPKERLAGGLSYLIGPVQGEIRNDFQTQRDHGITVEVSEKDYQNALAIKKKWESASYELTAKDCLSFAIEVAHSLSNDLNLPQRSTIDFPHDYIKELKLLNKPQNLCQLHPDIVTVYDKKESNYHIYTYNTEICDSKDNQCCTEQFVYNIMKSKGKYTAPYAGESPVTNCGIYELPFLGSIVTVLGDNPYSITNYTKNNHRLHKGKVVRYVVKVGSKIMVYTVGVGNNKNKVYKFLNENKLSVNAVWGSVDKKLKAEVDKQLNQQCGTAASTLFLFDLSGSMNDFGGGTTPKIEQAKEASKITLDAMRSGNQGVVNQVAVYGFNGGCSPDPTIEVSPFTTDLNAVERNIYTMAAGGGTPLANALRAAECKMAAHLQNEGQQKGKLIILSDGQGTCGNIRPPGVYNSAPLQRNRSVIVDASQCGFSNHSRAAVSYYTIGFNIPPGSPAERDLQYLSQISGGKYLNVQNQTQLARAFRKFNRIYQPKEAPALTGLPTASVNNFEEGVLQIKEEYFQEALTVYSNFFDQHPEDCHGVYNLALMQEANDFYKEAITHYEQYLSLCPDAADREFVEKQIKFLQEEFREFVLFQKEVVRSDLAFLSLHFERIQNGQSVALAEEFKGFLTEKDDYYEKLPRLIASDNRQLESLSEEIVSAFQQCAMLIRRNPQNWDRDAIPIISMAFLTLEELLEEM